MANRCLPGEESASRFFSRPSASVRFDSQEPGVLTKIDGKAFRSENSCYRTRIELCFVLDLWRPPVLDADSIKRGNLRLIPLLLSFPFRDEIHSRLSFAVGTHLSASYFPWEPQQPQQRHEKRLINKLIRFLPIPRRASPGLFFFSTDTSVPLLPAAGRTRGARPLPASGNAIPRTRIQLTFH